VVLASLSIIKWLFTFSFSMDGREISWMRDRESMPRSVRIKNAGWNFLPLLYSYRRGVIR